MLTYAYPNTRSDSDPLLFLNPRTGRSPDSSSTRTHLVYPHICLHSNHPYYRSILLVVGRAPAVDSTSAAAGTDPQARSPAVADRTVLVRRVLVNRTAVVVASRNRRRLEGRLALGRRRSGLVVGRKGADPRERSTRLSVGLCAYNDIAKTYVFLRHGAGVLLTRHSSRAGCGGFAKDGCCDAPEGVGFDATPCSLCG